MVSKGSNQVEALQAAKRDYPDLEWTELPTSDPLLPMQLVAEGQADAALTGVSDANASPYGRMQIAEVRLWIAIQRNDVAGTQRQLEFLRSHGTDSVETLEETLVHAGDTEGAAKLLITRLLDPDQRGSALLGVQGYALPTAPPLVVRDREQWSSLLNREDVRNAINQVGRLENYPLLPAQR